MTRTKCLIYRDFLDLLFTPKIAPSLQPRRPPPATAQPPRATPPATAQSPRATRPPRAAGHAGLQKNRLASAEVAGGLVVVGPTHPAASRAQAVDSRLPRQMLSAAFFARVTAMRCGP